MGKLLTIYDGVITIENTFINNLSSDLIKLNKCITDLNKKYWDIKVSDIYTTYNSTLKCINKFIADLDCHASNAFTSIKNAYFRPEIGSTNYDKSYVDIEGLRHPIAEQINKEREFIKNDIHLGCENSNQSGNHLSMDPKPSRQPLPQQLKTLFYLDRQYQNTQPKKHLV